MQTSASVGQGWSCLLRPEHEVDQVFRWSESFWWAWEDLNLRLHPYQVSRAKRCADRRFPRSPASVRGEGMRSNAPDLNCYQVAATIAHRAPVGLRRGHQSWRLGRRFTKQAWPM